MTSPNERSGPGLPTGTALNATNSLAPSVRRIEWAARLIEAGRPCPRYGSEEFLALADDSPAKLASILVAAECWARDADDLEQRLWDECIAASRSHKQAEDADYCARRDAHRESWTGTGFRVAPEELAAIEAEWREWVHS